MRILALDYGAASVGTAFSDPTGTLVRPGPTIAARVEEVAALAEREDAALILVGLPRHLAGGEGEQAVRTREFCRALEAEVSVPVETYDERLTTRMAEATRRAGARAAEDSLAAAHLLEGYLASRRRREDGDAA
jgi:putative Holliday junction resolvase